MATRKFRRYLTHNCPAMIGTVPIYDAVVYYHKPLKQITSGEWIDIVRMHARDGVDFMTIHCGINKETAHKFKKNKRSFLTNIVSRGGSIILRDGNDRRRKSFYEHYDEILISAGNMTLPSAWGMPAVQDALPTLPTRPR